MRIPKRAWTWLVVCGLWSCGCGAEAEPAAARGVPDRPAEGIRPIELTLVDPEDRTGSGTFQSHNQKVVANQGGIFMTHVRSRNEAYTAQTWRLSRSTDGGRSFRTIHEETVGTNPPALETDARGDLYLVRQDFAAAQDAFLYVFRRSEGYASHTVHAIPRGYAGKYATVLDEARERLYYFSHNSGELCVLDLRGRVRDRYALVAEGARAVQQYPHLALDEAGALYAAWTNVERATGTYRSIHFLRSPRADRRWERLDGTVVELPVAADETGASHRVTLDDEYDCDTWLWSFLPRNGKLHMAYLARTEPPRQHYVRYDLETGHEDRRVAPEWRGHELALFGLDGFAVGDPLHPSRSYWVGRDGERIAVLRSDDGGESWRDHARSEPAGNPYAIGGFRRVTDDRRLIGSFTDQGWPSRVLCFSVAAD